MGIKKEVMENEWIDSLTQEDFYNGYDMSEKDRTYDLNFGNSLRDKLRDFYDLLFRRTLYQVIYKNYFKQLPHEYNYALPSKGFSSKARIKWLNKYKKIKGAKVLNIGVGNGFDIPIWLRYNPKEFTGNDILIYGDSHEIVKRESKAISDTKINLYQKDILDLKVDEVGTFDIIASAAVFEHCQDMEKVAYKCFDLLKPNGMMYASYGGPLWYTYGGDHFSGRDNPKNGFNHLLLGKKEYWEYVKANVELTVDSELKAGGGGILVKLDLFSKLSSNEYLEIFKRVGFTVKKLILESCPIAAELIKDKKIRDALLEKYPNLNEDDFKCRTHIILLEKKA